MLHPPRRTIGRKLSRAARRPTVTARALAVCALAAGAVTLAGCGSNGVAEQSDEHTTETAANGHVGTVLIRDAQITVGADAGSGALAVTLFEQGPSPDTLTAVTSTQASAFTLPTLSTDGDASPAAATTATAVALPVMSAVSLNDGPDQITISGLTGAPQVGDAVPVTFRFTGAGTVTLDVPVVSDLPATFSPAPTVTDANVADGPSGSPSSG